LFNYNYSRLSWYHSSSLQVRLFVDVIYRTSKIRIKIIKLLLHQDSEVLIARVGCGILTMHYGMLTGNGWSDLSSDWYLQRHREHRGNVLHWPRIWQPEHIWPGQRCAQGTIVRSSRAHPQE